MKTPIVYQDVEPQRHRATESWRFSIAPRLCASVVKNDFGSFAVKTLLCLSMLLVMGILQGCKYPAPAKVEQKDARPAIGISGAPAGTLLYVDGLKMGPVGSYDGTAGVLLVESGKHVVEVKSADGDALFKQEVFLSSSTTRIIKYHP